MLEPLLHLFLTERRIHTHGHVTEELHDVGLVELQAGFPDVENCVFSPVVVGLDLVSHIDERHELINIDFTVIIGVHFSEQSSDLIHSHRLVAYFHNESLELSFVKRLAGFSSFSLRCDLLCVKGSHVFHGVVHCQDRELLFCLYEVNELRLVDHIVAILVHLGNDTLGPVLGDPIIWHLRDEHLHELLDVQLAIRGIGV